MNSAPLPSLGISFVVPNLADSPFCWRDAREAAAFLQSIFERADYAIDLQADHLKAVTLVSRRPLSPNMGHLALYVSPHDDADLPGREWIIEFDVTSPASLTVSDLTFIYVTRWLLADLIAALPGVLEVFHLDEEREAAAAE